MYFRDISIVPHPMLSMARRPSVDDNALEKVDEEIDTKLEEFFSLANDEYSRSDHESKSFYLFALSFLKKKMSCLRPAPLNECLTFHFRIITMHWAQIIIGCDKAAIVARPSLLLPASAEDYDYVETADYDVDEAALVAKKRMLDRIMDRLKQLILESQQIQENQKEQQVWPL